jgi:hypothetical protein
MEIHKRIISSHAEAYKHMAKATMIRNDHALAMTGFAPLLGRARASEATGEGLGVDEMLASGELG